MDAPFLRRIPLRCLAPCPFGFNWPGEELGRELSPFDLQEETSPVGAVGDTTRVGVPVAAL